VTDLDHVRMGSEPEAYCSELADRFRKENKEIKEQTQAINDLKHMIDANIQGPDIPALLQTHINTILNGQQGSLEQALEKLGENPEAIQKKQERIRNLCNQLGQIYANAGFQGKTSNSLNSAIQGIKDLDSAYSSYILSSQNAKPVIEKHLKV